MVKQKIVISPGIQESAMLKTLAAFGEHTFNTRYMSILEFSEYMLQLSGYVYKETFISDENLAVRLYKSIKDIKYFKDSSIIDIVHLVRSINDLRHFIIDNEQQEINKLKGGTFIHKNEAIIEVYNMMITFMNKNNLIDELGIIRLAYEKANVNKDIEYIIYDKSPILRNKLDIALINKVNGGEVKPIPIGDNKPLKIKSYTKSFGQTNEMENVLSYIYKSKENNTIKFDEYLIVSPDEAGYGNILTNYRDILGLNCIVATGVNVSETNPGKLFDLINQWIDSHYYYYYFNRMVFDLSFNLEHFKKDLQIPDDFDEINKKLDYNEKISFESIIQTAGELRLSFNSDKNLETFKKYISLLERYSLEGHEKDNTNRRIEEVPYLVNIINILNEGIMMFLYRYSNILDEEVDQNALEKIHKALSFEEHGVPYDEIKKVILNATTSKRLLNKDGLYFTSIRDGVCKLKKHLFIVGLSSNNFPGSAKEDPYLLDEDYELFGVKNASSRNIEDNKNAYFTLLEFANKYDVEIHLSYSYYNSQTLKEQNASSVIFETFKLENIDNNSLTIKDLENSFKDINNDKFQVVEYFEKDLLPITNFGRQIKEHKEIEFTPLITKDKEEISLDKIGGRLGLSASNIALYIDCPYQLFLSNVLKVKQEEKINPYEIIPANDEGTLAHLLLEKLDKKIIKTRDDFIPIISQAFDDYLIFHPCVNQNLANKVKEEFIEMALIGYDMEGTEVTAFKEVDRACKHIESGLTIHGLPDKVIRNSNGTYTIVDYKTSRAIKHLLNDKKTMLQCVVYAYVIEKILGDEVSSFEYRYIRLKEIVSSNKDGVTMDEYYQVLEEVLNDIKKSYEEGYFPTNEKHCGDCYYASVCPKRKVR